jgi:hypothetical protein
MRRLLINILLFPVFLGFAVEGEAAIPPADDGAGEGAGDGNNDAGDGQNAPDEAQVEADRRAALSDEERAAEDQTKADEAKKLEGAPEAYEDFKIPEGMEAAKELLDDFKPLLKDDLNLSQEKAQKLIDFYTTKVIPEMKAKGIAVWNNELAARTREIEGDPEIGGEKLKSTGEAVNRVANTFLKPEESTEMMEYFKRFGDCKPFLKLLSRVSVAMKEDGMIMGSASAGDGKEKTLAERLYGS